MEATDLRATLDALIGLILNPDRSRRRTPEEYVERVRGLVEEAIQAVSVTSCDNSLKRELASLLGWLKARKPPRDLDVYEWVRRIGGAIRQTAVHAGLVSPQCTRDEAQEVYDLMSRAVTIWQEYEHWASARDYKPTPATPPYLLEVVSTLMELEKEFDGLGLSQGARCFRSADHGGAPTMALVEMARTLHSVPFRKGQRHIDVGLHDGRLPSIASEIRPMKLALRKLRRTLRETKGLPESDRTPRILGDAANEPADGPAFLMDETEDGLVTVGDHRGPVGKLKRGSVPWALVAALFRLPRGQMHPITQVAQAVDAILMTHAKSTSQDMELRLAAGQFGSAPEKWRSRASFRDQLLPLGRQPAIYADLPADKIICRFQASLRQLKGKKARFFRAAWFHWDRATDSVTVEYRG